MRKSIQCLLLFLIVIPLNAQISTNELPVSFSLRHFGTRFVSAASVLEEAKLLDMRVIAEEDVKDEEESVPPRFGIPIKVDFNLSNSGVWTQLDNGDKIWQHTISSPGAPSLAQICDLCP